MGKMKKKIHGPSLYYASDKNILDALNQHRVNMQTIRDLFLDRRILVSKESDKDDLAYYFSRLTHDYYDHNKISARLGVAARREKVTSLEVTSQITSADILNAVEKLKADVSDRGDVVIVDRKGDDFHIIVQYTDIDYTKMEFRQVQKLDGTVQFVKSGGSYIVRNTQNRYINDVRETLLARVAETTKAPVVRNVISLFDVVEPATRSEFFHKLITGLEGMPKTDVTDVFVYKRKNDDDSPTDESTDGDGAGNDDAHIERVALKGKGVNQSKELHSLLEPENEFYIVKIVWVVRESMGDGHAYEIEAQFASPSDCTDFSYLIRGVYACEDGLLSSKKRTAYKTEVERVSRLVEQAAKQAMNEVKGA